MATVAIDVKAYKSLYNKAKAGGLYVENLPEPNTICNHYGYHAGGKFIHNPEKSFNRCVRCNNRI